MSSAPVNITILVGTMTGTAQLVAQELELAWDDGETKVSTLVMDGLDCSVFERPGVFLICTSTYGQGDVPDNAKALYADLQAKRPNLSQVRYGVFGLVEMIVFIVILALGLVYAWRKGVLRWV